MPVKMLLDMDLASPHVATPTTFNPLDKDVTITLSGGNLTYTGSGAARATNPLSAGKAYWEVLVNQAAGDTAWNVGFTDALTTLASIPAGGSLMFVFLGSGSASQGGTGPGSAFANGDVVCIALDIGAKNIWFRKNGGNWNNSGLADPATGVGPNTFVVAGPYYAAAASNVGTTSYTANFGATAFSFIKPSGFTSWNGLV